MLEVCRRNNYHCAIEMANVFKPFFQTRYKLRIDLEFKGMMYASVERKILKIEVLHTVM
jgi:hypothetical protein